jgi:hypothetical protein
MSVRFVVQKGILRKENKLLFVLTKLEGSDEIYFKSKSSNHLKSKLRKCRSGKQE